MAQTGRGLHPTLGYIRVSLAPLCQTLHISIDRLNNLLTVHGCTLNVFNLVELARAQIGKPYLSNPVISRNPKAFDCAGFTRWVYAHAGFALEHYTVGQVDQGRSVNPNDINAGDLIFTRGTFPWKHPQYHSGVGHVAFATDSEHCLHITSKSGGVQEIPIAKIGHRLVTVRCILPLVHAVTVVSLDSSLQDIYTPKSFVHWLRSVLQHQRRLE